MKGDETRMYNRYREFAKALGLTDYRVAQLSGVSRQSICEWHCGKHQLSLGNRYKISVVLGTDVDFTRKLA